jgi:hypothetical protein
VALHQDFKFAFVTKFPEEGWQMTADEIRRWVDLHAATLDLSEWEDEYSDD